jgi:putrescine transport system ATP-binding protein
MIGESLTSNHRADETFIRIENVTKKFGTVSAVERVSLDIRKGEVFCLLGGSGSGKSTLLRMLAGFDRPTEGRIILDGMDISNTPPERMPVNMMFQSYALFPHMSVERNIGYGLRREGVARAEINNRVAAILDMVKLSPYAKRLPSQLSGGQRQRVALARCIVKRPKVLLLDEPLAALDKKLREETQQELLKIQRELGLTFIVVTHDQEEAMTMANRIGVMNLGQIVQIGSPRELYERPNSLFIADFVGTLNRNLGQVIGHENGKAVVRLADEMIVKLLADRKFNISDQVIVTVRPEKLSLLPAGTKEKLRSPNSFEGKVAFVSYMGGVTNYSIELRDGIRLQITQQNRDASIDAPMVVGDSAYVNWPIDGSHIFMA